MMFLISISDVRMRNDEVVSNYRLLGCY